MLTPTERQVATDGDEIVRRWPWVSLNIRTTHLAEWGALAKALGRSRADLLREALEQTGLPYARAMARTRAAAEAARAAGVSSTASSASPALTTGEEGGEGG